MTTNFLSEGAPPTTISESLYVFGSADNNPFFVKENPFNPPIAIGSLVMS